MLESGPDMVAFSIRGPITRGDLPGLCDRVRELLSESAATVAVCDVSDVEPDAVTVDALARLQLAVRRTACKVRLRGASPELCALIGFMGLEDVICIAPPTDEIAQHGPKEDSWHRG